MRTWFLQYGTVWSTYFKLPPVDSDYSFKLFFEHLNICKECLKIVRENGKDAFWFFSFLQSQKTWLLQNWTILKSDFCRKQSSASSKKVVIWCHILQHCICMLLVSVAPVQMFHMGINSDNIVSHLLNDQAGIFLMKKGHRRNVSYL